MEVDGQWRERAHEVAAGIVSRRMNFTRGCEELATLRAKSGAYELLMFRSWCDPTVAGKRWITDEAGAKTLARTLLRILDEGWEAVAIDLTPPLLEARDLLVHHPPGHLEAVYYKIAQSHPEWLAESDWGGDDWGHFSLEVRPPPDTPSHWQNNELGWRTANAESVGSMHIRVPIALCNTEWGDGLAEEARKQHLAVVRYELPDMPIYTVDRSIPSSLFARYASVVAEAEEEDYFFLSDFMYDTM